MHTETTESAFEGHLFEDEVLFAHHQASTGQRFLNFLIDALIMQCGLGLLTGFIIVYLLMVINENAAYSFLNNEGSLQFIRSTYLISIVNYLLYYTICEKLFK